MSEFFFSQYLQNVDVPIKTHMNITAVSIKWYFVTYGTSVSKRCEIFWELYLFRLSIDECIMFLNTLRKNYPYKGGFFVQIDLKIDANRNKRCVKNHMIQYIPVDCAWLSASELWYRACTFHWIILLAMVLVFFIFFLSFLPMKLKIIQDCVTY